jgi:hypothetical protein
VDLLVQCFSDTIHHARFYGENSRRTTDHRSPLEEPHSDSLPVDRDILHILLCDDKALLCR